MSYTNDDLILGDKYRTIWEKIKDPLDGRNYPFPHEIIKQDQYIGDLYGGSRIHAVYRLNSPSNLIELPNVEGRGVMTYRVKATRVDTDEPEVFEGGTFKENFVLLTKNEAREVIKHLRQQKLMT